VAVLFSVGAVAVAVLEVDAKVLDGLALQAFRRRGRTRCRRCSASRPIAEAKVDGVGGVCGEHAEAELAEARRGVGA
jgi:hypothetical protein